MCKAPNRKCEILVRIIFFFLNFRFYQTFYLEYYYYYGEQTNFVLWILTKIQSQDPFLIFKICYFIIIRRKS